MSLSENSNLLPWLVVLAGISAGLFILSIPLLVYFQKLGNVPLSFWFHALAGSEGDFGAMAAVIAASDTAGASAGEDTGGGGSSGAG